MQVIGNIFHLRMRLNSTSFSSVALKLILKPLQIFQYWAAIFVLLIINFLSARRLRTEWICGKVVSPWLEIRFNLLFYPLYILIETVLFQTMCFLFSSFKLMDCSCKQLRWNYINSLSGYIEVCCPSTWHY